jgi:hypothetical protein
MLLEIFLHYDFGAYGAQVASERVAAGPELTGDGGQENLHFITPS